MTATPSKPALLTAGLAIVMAAAAAPPSHAVDVDYAFDVTIDAGPLTPNQYSGTFSYNNSTKELTLFEFMFEGTTYTASDDPDAEAVFDGNTFLGIDYSSPPGLPSFSFTSGFFDVSDALFTYDLNPGTIGQGGTGPIVYQRLTTPSVPGPVPVLGAAAFFGYSRRLRKRTAHRDAPR